MNYYSFHIGDYAAHTRNLSLMEDLAYRRLLDAYYLGERALAGSIEDIAREIGMREHQAAVEYVLGKFFQTADGCWHSARCDAEIAKYRRMEEGGRAGAAKRWGKGGDTPPIAPLSPTQTPPNANQEPLTNNHKSTTDVVEKLPRIRATAMQCPADVQPDTWTDFLAVRKSKKAPMTPTALQGVRREAEKAGVSLQQALQTCCTRGWAGFNADWYRGSDANKLQAPAETTYQRSMRERMQEAVPEIARRTPGAPREIHPTEFFLEAAVTTVLHPLELTR